MFLAWKNTKKILIPSNSEDQLRYFIFVRNIRSDKEKYSGLITNK